MRTHESEEMYLETILLLKERMQTVRSVDVVTELGYAKSSVSRAVNLLAGKGLIAIDGNGDITLTEEGKKKAVDIYQRHRVITEVLVKMGAERNSAEENACRIEHVISEDVLAVLEKFNQEH